MNDICKQMFYICFLLFSNYCYKQLKKSLKSLYNCSKDYLDEIASRDFNYQNSWEVGVEEFENSRKEKDINAN